MAKISKKKSAPMKVESIRRKDKRTNTPTEELRDFVADDELAPKTMLYACTTKTTHCASKVNRKK
jgi:hypothetical protein